MRRAIRTHSRERQAAVRAAGWPGPVRETRSVQVIAHDLGENGPGRGDSKGHFMGRCELSMLDGQTKWIGDAPCVLKGATDIPPPRAPTHLL